MPEPAVLIVGHCTSTTANIFCCSPVDAGPLSVAYLAWRAGGQSGTEKLTLNAAPPYRIGVFRLEGLPAGAQVEYGVDVRDEADPAPDAAELLAAPRRFRLLPADRPLRVALVSCNGFAKADREHRWFQLWDRLREQVEAGNVDLIVHAGDQIYADAIWDDHDTRPEGRDLRPDQAERVQALVSKYRDKYVDTWRNPGIARVLASCPNLMTWDDHDIYDGYGSHDDDDQPAQQAFLAAARQAYEEFQLSHGPERLHDESYLKAMVHGEVGIVLLDTRSNRMWEQHRVLGDAQIERLKQWGEENAAGLKRLYVVSSVPLVHAEVAGALWLLRIKPGTESFEDDLRDAWVASNNRMECHRLTKWLFHLQVDNDQLQVTVLGGDVHVGSLGEIRSHLAEHRRDGLLPRMFQVTSSGIGSPPEGALTRFLIRQVTDETLTLGTADITGRLVRMNGSRFQVWERRNFAVLRVEGDGQDWDPYGNLRVDFHVEVDDECRVFPQVLNGPGWISP